MGGYYCVGINNQTGHKSNGLGLNIGYYPSPSANMVAPCG